MPTVIVALLAALGAYGVPRIIAARKPRHRLPDGLLDLARILEGQWPQMQARLRASGVPLNDYDGLVARGDADALMPEDVSNAMLNNLEEKANGSAVMKLFKRVPVARAQTRFPVLSALPIAYWVNGDTGLKQTTEQSWANKYLNIEEIAVIVPIPENVIDDSAIPIWSQVQPLCEEAAARLLDQTVMFGSAPGGGAIPSSFPQNVVAAADAAGNDVTIGTSTDADGGIVGDHSLMLDAVEADGYDPTGGLARRTLRGLARQARNTQGNRLGEVTVTRDTVEIDGVQYTFPMRGQWPTGSGAAVAVAIDGSEFVLGVRQDITWKLLDQAVITNGQGEIVYNLPQQDMVAMRMKLRVGWQVANTINYDEAVEANRYPAGLLKAA